MKYIILFLVCVFVLIGCSEIHQGMSTDELLLAGDWGKPKDTIQIRDTSYEIWWYISSYIDNILFIKDGKVIERKKYSPSDNIWETVRQWVLYAEREPVYNHNIDEHVNNIIKEKINIGMIPEEIRLAWGPPKEIRTQLSKYGNKEVWLYQRSQYEITALTFINGLLTEVNTE